LYAGPRKSGGGEVVYISQIIGNFQCFRAARADFIYILHFSTRLFLQIPLYSYPILVPSRGH
jgi:hypothetical protein